MEEKVNVVRVLALGRDIDSLTFHSAQYNFGNEFDMMRHLALPHREEYEIRQLLEDELDTEEWMSNLQPDAWDDFSLLQAYDDIKHQSSYIAKNVPAFNKLWERATRRMYV